MWRWYLCAESTVVVPIRLSMCHHLSFSSVVRIEWTASSFLQSSSRRKLLRSHFQTVKNYLSIPKIIQRLLSNMWNARESAFAFCSLFAFSHCYIIHVCATYASPQANWIKTDDCIFSPLCSWIVNELFAESFPPFPPHSKAHYLRRFFFVSVLAFFHYLFTLLRDEMNMHFVAMNCVSLCCWNSFSAAVRSEALAQRKLPYEKKETRGKSCINVCFLLGKWGKNMKKILRRKVARNKNVESSSLYKLTRPIVEW